MVRVGRWSESGGDMVPAVILLAAVVRLMSIRVAEVYRVSYLVGVSMVVLRLCSNMNVVRGLVCLRLSRFRLRSP